MPSTPDLSTATWRKSTHSNGDGGHCVEIAEGFPGAAEWIKSSHSDFDHANCVEWAPAYAPTGLVPVRDSKTPHAPALLFPAPSWSAFVTALKTARLPVRSGLRVP
ncbi:DUF397 domain-containing protein [Streptomyces sp. B1866]|uniref:DUF397 domain-containing protein n=1 Tax=Streptomyces sp. B1866 TaxID=3075431 RepID=UPI00288D49F4|nr:DUF397 domain-containing protein [Streptomyces sp. B1866]MDT3399077.1 DUF397 domain-containing protein [Streptomyces sp. B1866]